MNNQHSFTAVVERMLPEGEALARTPTGDYYRVRHAVPADKVSLSPLKKRRGIAYAKLEKVLQASPHRVDPACPVAARCGGCALQYVQANAQASIKSAWVKHAFSPVFHHETDWQAVVHRPFDKVTQRRRVRWQVCVDELGVHLGFFAHQSHAVVTTPYCMVLTEVLNRLRQALEVCFSVSPEHAPESVYAVQLHDGVHLVLTYEKKIDADIFSLPQSLSMPVQYWQRCGLSLKPISYPIRLLSDILPTSKTVIALNIGPDDFVQGQRLGNESMIQQVLTWSKGATRVVDLFSGVGNLSLPLAASGMRVLGAEVNTASVRAANSNAKRLNLDAHYEQADLFKNFDVSGFVGADVLLIDPPRKGARNICRLLPRLMPQCVIFIHCDVNSAHVDALEMLKQGYRLKALRALDLFPYSGHVESMSLWER
ncbi:MAG: class I SAM-dependent RNA methyltransferase [Zetaproteobacteria bacterium]|nr:class I SAM-dependent RNA methyltransferase [Zetaproteobacteria bacterium]